MTAEALSHHRPYPASNAHCSDTHRQPPQDLSAEQSVLGGMLLSKDAIVDVVEVLRPDDFYRPAHQAVYECILDLYGRGEPADAITVSSELQRRGDLIRLGGAPYLHTLIATVPTAANAAYYAEIVAEKASCAGWSRPAPGSCSWVTTGPTAPRSTRLSIAPRRPSTT